MKTILATIAGAGAMLAAGQLRAGPVPAADTPAEVAACVVDNDSADVKMMLKTVPGSPAETKASRPVLSYYGSCNDNQAAAGALAWRDRAEIANAALVKRIGGATPDLAAATQPGWALTIARGKIAGVDYDATAVGMRMLGDCIVRAAPQASADLARSAPDSIAERTAIGQLAPTLAPCLPAGQNLRVRRADLRLVVAEPLYHLISR